MASAYEGACCKFLFLGVYMKTILHGDKSTNMRQLTAVKSAMLACQLFTGISRRGGFVFKQNGTHTNQEINSSWQRTLSQHTCTGA